MKGYLLFFVGIMLFISCSKDEFLEEISNPNVLRSQSVDVSSFHLAFPSITGNKDRSKILIAYREGSTHVSFDGKIVQMESFDMGKTWMNRKVIYDPAGSLDARDPQLLTLKDNHVLCRFFERASNSESVVKSISSFDFGGYYKNSVNFPFPTRDETFAAARGNMVAIDDVIYTVCYNRWSYSWIVKSEDEGKSWKVVSWIDTALGTPNSLYARINETSLGYMDGKMYLVARQEEDNAFLQMGVSEDLGATWKWSELPMKGQAPSLTPYKDNFILTYRHIEDEKYSFNVALLKGDQLVSDPISLFVSPSFDIGYGDVLTLPNSFLVCCYSSNSIKCYELKYNIFD